MGNGAIARPLTARATIPDAAVPWIGRGLVVAALVLMVAAYHVIHGTNSDDVAQQDLVASLLSGQPLDFGGSQDHWLIRLPLYLATSWLFGTTAGLLVQVLVCDLVLAIGAIMALEAILAAHRDRSPEFRLACYVPLAWFVGQTAALEPPSGDPYGTWATANSRLADAGILLMLLVWVAPWIGESLQGRAGAVRAVRRGALLALAVGVLCWDDPYFLGLGAGGLVLGAAWIALRPAGVRSGTAVVAAAAAAGGGLMLAFQALGDAVGLHVVGGVSTRLADLATIGEQLLDAGRWTAVVFRAEVRGSVSPALNTLFGFQLVLLALAVLGAVAAAVRAWRRRDALRSLLLGAVVAGYGAYVLVDVAHLQGDARYVFAPAAMLVVLAPDALAALPVRWWRGAAASLAALGLVFGMALNLVTALGGLPTARLGPVTARTAELLDALERLDVPKAYATFTDANVVTYFSGRRVLALPLTCGDDGEAMRSSWLVNASDFDLPAARTALVLDRREPAVAGCLDAFAASLGPPLAATALPLSGARVLVYGRDIAAGLDAGGAEPASR